MSWLSSGLHKLGSGITNVAHTIGRVASNPIVEGAAGLFGGPLAGAAVGGLGHLLEPGGNLGRAAGGALTGGLAGGAGGLVRKLGTGVLAGGVSGAAGMLHPTGTFGRTSTMGADQVQGGIPGSGSWTDHIVDFDEGGNPIYDTDLDAGSIMGGGSSGGGGFWGGVRKLGSGLLNGVTGGSGGSGGGLGNLALGGLAGYQALNAANASKRAGQLSDKAINLAESQWNAGAPLRTAGQARLLNPTRPDLSGVFANASNPFAAPLAPPASPVPPQVPPQLAGGVGGLIRKLSAGGLA